MKNKILRYTKRIIAQLILLALMAAPVYAAVPPNSGTALDSVKPPTVQQEAQPSPDINVEKQVPAPGEDGEKIPVSAFCISGESPVPTAELLQLIQREAGKDMTLGELNSLAGKLTQYLRQQGYLVAFAYIPSQDIKEGIVEIAIIPGKYGQVKIIGHSHMDPGRLQAMLFPAKPGTVITREPLERALLLISDLAGIRVKATLAPGEADGTADLLLETADTAKTSGALYSDNWGNRYTGRIRYGVQITVNNVSGMGDTFNLGGLTTRQGINNYNFGYSAPLGHDGAKININYSHLDYTLGDTFADLDATGQAIVTSYQVAYPFVRRRTLSLYGSLGYDRKQLRDDIADYGSYSHRTSQSWKLGLSGIFADTWLGGGNNAFSLTHYRGHLHINDMATRAYDATTTQTNGHFAKTVLTWERQQYVAQNLSFNLDFTGQLADKNLDSSEKIYLGGADGVRAYPQGEASGDQGYKLTSELRWRLPGLSTADSSLYLNTFYDYGNVMVNKRPYNGAGDNRRSLMGAGLGLLWVRDRDFAVRMDYAWKIGEDQTAANRDKRGCFWLQGVKYF